LKVLRPFHFSPSPLSHVTHVTDKCLSRIKNVSHILRALNFVYLLWAAFTVELTLNWNHVKDTTGGTALSATGQQLHAIIGAFAFLRVLWLLWKDWREVCTIARSPSWKMFARFVNLVICAKLILILPLQEKTRRAAEVGEDGEGIDVKLSDLDRDGEGNEEDSLVSTKMSRTLGKIDTASKPVPNVRSLD